MPLLIKDGDGNRRWVATVENDDGSITPVHKVDQQEDVVETLVEIRAQQAAMISLLGGILAALGGTPGTPTVYLGAQAYAKATATLAVASHEPSNLVLPAVASAEARLPIVMARSIGLQANAVALAEFALRVGGQERLAFAATAAAQASIALAFESASPQAVVAPTILGSGAAGQPMVVQTGIWSQPVTLEQQWGYEIDGAPDLSMAAQAIAIARIALVPGNQLLAFAAAASATATLSLSGPPVFTTLPVMSGTYQVGQTASVTDGQTDQSTTVSRRWGYLTQDTNGVSLAFVAEAIATAGLALAPPPVFTTEPAMSGTFQVGQTASVTDGVTNQTTTVSRKWGYLT